jgi:long-chain acyl-CoA synthetase
VTSAAISADGWFATGKVDDDGYYHIVDRKKDLIIRGGINVYPRDIKEVLYERLSGPRLTVANASSRQ